MVLVMKEFINEFLNQRPEVIGAFGYGSGIFKQLGYDNKEKPQIDLILVVENLRKWHEENIKKNPKDYSLIGKNFFLKADMKKIKGLTGITYQSNIEYKNHLFKYGIIEYKDFIENLDTWNSFYVPGRLQKPILILKSNETIDNLIIKNRRNACKIGLLCLSEKKLTNLYLTICSLSYTGDTRMKVAENPNKVNNIVGASFAKFNEMYDFNDLYTKNGENIEYELHLDDLPDLLKNVKKTKEDILNYLYELNKKESFNQTLKGLKTNGIIKSAKYGFAKILKKFK